MTAPRYATASQLSDHIDTRLLAQLSSDDGTDGAINLTTNTALAAALERASSDVQSHVLRGQMYSSSDLDTLQTAEDTTLLGLVCDLTLFHLAVRRGGDISPAILERYRAAKDTLKALASGAQIFGLDTGAASAGTGQIKVINSNTRDNLNLVSDVQFFPPRRTQAY